MNKKHLETLILGAVVLLVLTGSLFTADTDRDIESNARKSYVFKNYLKNDDIQISSRDGVVTLTGSVSDESHIALAEDVISDIPGVKRVDNQLRVSGQIPEKNSDIWLRSRINSMIRLHSNLDADNTQIEVKDGRVTVRGEADSQAQKGLITEYIKDIEGVKDVDNEMTVTKKPKKSRTLGEFIDDASIKAQIKSALLFHRGTSPFRADIKVRKGVVTVTGNAKSAAEKELITKRIENIHGVRRINNRMTIE